MRGAALRGALALIAGVGLGARAAAGEGPPAPRPVEVGEVLGGASRCPDPASVWQALGTLLPPERLAARLAAVVGTLPRIELVDLGGSFRVIAAGRTREYRDEGRDCPDRARIAAVVVALAIDPAAVMTGELAPPPPPAPPPPLPAPAGAPSPPLPVLGAPVSAPALGPRSARLYVGPIADLGWGAGTALAQPGMALRFAAGRDRVAVSAAAAATWPVESEIGGVRARHRRFPFDVALRAQLPGERLHAFGEVGVAAAMFSVSAVDLATVRGGTVIELGARLSFGVELATRRRVAPFAAIQAEVVPAPPRLFALPEGPLGRTPFLWIGASVGASIGWPG